MLLHLVEFANILKIPTRSREFYVVPPEVMTPQSVIVWYYDLRCHNSL